MWWFCLAADVGWLADVLEEIPKPGAARTCRARPGPGGVVTRPAAPERRPNFALFAVAFFASSLILVVWVAGQWVLRMTGWPR